MSDRKALVASRPALALVRETSKGSRIGDRENSASARTRRPDRTWLNDKGYLMIYAPEHPNANANGAMMAHRYVASQALGRPLAAHERVHHKLPGRRGVWPKPDELEVWVTAHPAGQRVSDIAKHARRQLAAELRARRDRRLKRQLRRHPLGALELGDVLRDEFDFTSADLRAALRQPQPNGRKA